MGLTLRNRIARPFVAFFLHFWNCFGHFGIVLGNSLTAVRCRVLVEVKKGSIVSTGGSGALPAATACGVLADCLRSLWCFTGYTLAIRSPLGSEPKIAQMLHWLVFSDPEPSWIRTKNRSN